MLKLRRLHLYLGVFFAPLLLFFIVTGWYQTAYQDRRKSVFEASAIMDRLQTFFKGHTVVVIAHRLSTVKQADQIIVLDGGRIVEQGTHDELTRRRGRYLELVKNQLELGNA